MIARRPQILLFALAAFTAALRAAQVNPPPAIDPKGALPSAIPAEPAKSETAVTSAPPPATNAPAAVSPAGAVTPAAAAPAATKPGIFSAVKAKGPPTAKTPAVAIPLSPRFQQIRDRMGALFNTRSAAHPPAEPAANPFRPPGAAPVAPLPGADVATSVPVALNADLTALQQAVATLRVRGTVTRNKVLQLVINTGSGKEGTYKENDVINVALGGGESVHVRVRQISAHSVTLTVNEAEMVLKF